MAVLGLTKQDFRHSIKRNIFFGEFACRYRLMLEENIGHLCNK